MGMLWRHRLADVPAEPTKFETVDVPESALAAVAEAIEQAEFSEPAPELETPAEPVEK